MEPLQVGMTPVLTWETIPKVVTITMLNVILNLVLLLEGQISRKSVNNCS